MLWNPKYSADAPLVIESSYIVDDSHFLPSSEAVKRLGLGTALSHAEIEQYYDNENVNSDLPFTRSAEFKDIAELSAHMHEKQRIYEKAMKDEKDYQERKKKWFKVRSDAVETKKDDEEK